MPEATRWSEFTSIGVERPRSREYVARSTASSEGRRRGFTGLFAFLGDIINIAGLLVVIRPRSVFASSSVGVRQ